MDRGSSSSCSQTERRQNSKHEAKKLNDSLFELYKPPGKRNVQIVFFHGFQLGHYEDAHLSTWESRDGGFVWPQTWLVEEFPHAHILTVGYNTRLTKRNSDGNLDLDIIGENLMSDLISVENVGQDPRCPLILVGHSFGGIVIKQLCVYARERGHPSHERFLENLKGVFFYSTPHHGGEFLTFAPFFMSKSLLLEHVEILSKSAARLHYNFENLRNVHCKHWQIEALGESQPTEWGNSKSVVVKEASSRYGNNYQIVEDANHMTVCQPKEKTSRAFKSLTNLVNNIISISKVSSDIHQTQGLPSFSSGLERRVEDVKNMLKRSTSRATVVGIVGMGGVGKTTIAKKLFNEISFEYEYTCFVDNAKGFSTHALDEYLLRSFYRYGTKVEIDDMQLSPLKEKKTLIVMDDIDKKDQLKHLPNSDHFGDGSHLIITTRDRGVFDKYPDCPFYDVDLLDGDEARKLLRYHVFGLDNIPPRLEKCVDEVLKKCKGLPLTLEVMGRYLRSYKNDVGFWEQTIEKLGAAQPIDGKKDDRVRASLRVSYDGLEKEEQDMFIEAGTLFFEQLLEEALAAWSTSNGAVENTWDNLLRRSFVKEVQGEHGGHIWVHEHLRDLAKEVSQRDEVSTHDVQTFGIPNSSDPILVYEKALGKDHPSTLTIVNNLRNLYSEVMYKRALAGYEKALRKDHPSTLTTVNNLGNLYSDQVKFAEAEEMPKRALAGKEKALGKDHVSTLDPVCSLGVLYHKQGKYAEAEEMYKRALAGYEKALGKDHPSTLTTVNNLGNLYSDLGKFAEEEEMDKRALAGYEKAVGKDHPSESCSLEADTKFFGEPHVNHNGEEPVIDEQADGIEVFIKEVRKGEEDGFFVSIDWLCNLKEHEQKDILSDLSRSGYSETSQTTTTILFARIESDLQQQMKNKDPASPDTESLVCPGDLGEAGAGKGQGGNDSTGREGSWIDRGWRRFKETLSPFNGDGHGDKGSASFGIANTTETSGSQVDSSCHPQDLRVDCSSRRMATILPPIGDTRQIQFGDLVVKMPTVRPSYRVSTITDGCFVFKKFTFHNGRPSELPVNMKATAETSLSCCLLPDQGLSKVRIKFHRLRGEVEYRDPVEVACEWMVLSSLCTNVYCCIKRRDTQHCVEQIILKLEDEYIYHPGRRVVPQLTADPTSSDDLVWLAKSKMRPVNHVPDSIGIELTSDVNRRRKADQQIGVQRAHILEFDEPRPVVFEGNIRVPLQPLLVLEIHVRYKLEVSYYKALAPIVNDSMWSGSCTSQFVDFDCCLEMKTDNILLG